MDVNTPDDRRIEDFRLDLPDSEIAEATAMNIRAVASQAYLYALPTFIHMRQLTEFIAGRRYLASDEPPIGGWILVRTLADPTTNNALPNVDTLYGAAYLLLAEHGPVVLTLPPISDRYFSIALLDSYFNNFEIVGTSSGETQGVRLLVVPPGWEGSIPSDVDRVIEAPTPVVTLYQRIFVRDTSELERITALQDQITLAPASGGAFGDLDLARWDRPDIRETVDPVAMFTDTKAYIALNGWPTADTGLIALFDSVGLGPTGFLPTDEHCLEAIRSGSADAQRTIDARLSSGPFRRGWNVPDPDLGISGPHALSRAAAQVSQIGSLVPSEAVYFIAHLDGGGAPLSGVHQYSITFDAGTLPPLNDMGFWSVTMYGGNSLLVDNELNRYILRPDSGLEYGPDGSLTLLFSANAPAGVPLANWLPTPTTEFIVGFRAYLPTAAVTNGEWFPPEIEKSHDS